MCPKARSGHSAWQNHCRDGMGQRAAAEQGGLTLMQSTGHGLDMSALQHPSGRVWVPRPEFKRGSWAYGHGVERAKWVMLGSLRPLNVPRAWPLGNLCKVRLVRATYLGGFCCGFKFLLFNNCLWIDIWTQKTFVTKLLVETQFARAVCTCLACFTTVKLLQTNSSSSLFLSPATHCCHCLYKCPLVLQEKSYVNVFCGIQ